MNVKIIWLTIAMLRVNCLCFSQEKIENKFITISFENKELKYVFQHIEKESGVLFAFSNDIGAIKSSGRFTNEPLVNVLKKIASQIGLEYQMVGGQMVISKKKGTKSGQNIRGQVYDEHTHVGFPGATIKVIGSDPAIGSVTSMDGTFVLNDLPFGKYSLEISFIGYQTKVEENIILGAGKEVLLSIGMIESVEKLDEILISGYNNKVEPTNQMAVVSARSISSDEAQRFAGSLNDPARMWILQLVRVISIDIIRIFQHIASQHGDDAFVGANFSGCLQLPDTGKSRGTCGFATNPAATNHSLCIRNFLLSHALDGTFVLIDESPEAITRLRAKMPAFIEKYIGEMGRRRIRFRVAKKG